MYELIYIYGILTFLFVLLTITVLRRSKDVPNKFFALTTILFALSTIINLIQQINILVFLREEDIFLATIGSMGFFLAPVGIFFSAYTIIHGYSTWRRIKPVTFVLLYTFIEFSLLMNHNGLQLTIISRNVSSALYTALVCIPLFLSGNSFIKVHNLSENRKKNILVLVLGIFVGSIGEIFNSVFIFLGQDNNVFALMVILVGVFASTFSFIQFSNRNTEIITIQDKGAIENFSSLS